MKKISKLFMALICIGMLLTINVNADSWIDSNMPEELKTKRDEAIERIKEAIPDSVEIDLKEIEALDLNADVSNHKAGELITDILKEAFKEKEISFPIELSVETDEGIVETVKINEPMAVIYCFDIDYEKEEVNIIHNVNTAVVEMQIETHVSNGGSSIPEDIKTIKVTYSDSDMRNEEDQKYVEEKVTKDEYPFLSVSELVIHDKDEDEDIPYDYTKDKEDAIAYIKEQVGDDTLEYKHYLPETIEIGDIDFSLQTWLVFAYKNGIPYKAVFVENFKTYKITIPASVGSNKDDWFKYVGDLLEDTNLGRPTSMEMVEDIRDYFEGVEAFSTGYYKFKFDDEDKSEYVFKLVQDDTVIPITSVKTNKTSLNLVKGKSERIVATIDPLGTTDSKVLSWTSSNKNVATVDGNGNVKAIAAGTAIITVKTSNGKTATVKVTVTNPVIAITSVKINQSSPIISIGKTTKLTATINPSNTTQSKTLTWSSSNKSVATVDKNGTVKGIKAGTATITVKTSNGKTASVKVTVKKATPIKSVKLNKSSAKLEINKTLQLKATINPSGTTDSKTLTWSSSNKKVATVDKNGKVTAKAAGTAKITVKTSNGKKATVKITVSKINAKNAKIASIKNQTQTGKALKPGITVTLNGKTLKNGTDYTVTYKNNKNAGKATVTVKFKGNYTGSKTATFLIIPSKVSIKNPSTTKKAITVKYSKVSGAKTYQIAYRVKGTTKWSYTTSTSASKKISKLTSGKQYEVCVRAGIKNGSKTLYGAWSNVKTIKVK